jgi:DNA polymerase V
MVLTIGYDRENLSDPEIAKHYHGPVTMDHYGRPVPKHAHGTVNLEGYTSSTREIIDGVMALFDRIVDKNLLIRRVNIVANHVLPESRIPGESTMVQLDLFADPKAEEEKQVRREQAIREKRRQKALLEIRKKYGKNAILKGMNFEEGATAMDRNSQIGGHKA